MTNITYKKGPDPRIIYKDIIDLPHHQSETHPHMSLYDRAAQFAPFAALTGYEEMVNEEARVTDYEKLLVDAEKDKLSSKLNLILDAIKNGQYPEVTITYFIPDQHKAGGEYATIKEKIKNVDIINRKLVLLRKKDNSQINLTIDLETITDLSGPAVESFFN